MHHTEDQRPDSMKIIVGIQMDHLQFGVTQQIQKRDGKTVNQLSQFLDQRNVQEKNVRTTEANKTKLEKI